MATDDESLQALLNKATNPFNKDDDLEAIKNFAIKLNREYDSHQNAVRLIAHKIQSPQERESLQALMVLEHCSEACDKRFHTEIGKFRFLNEMIKLVSPKYLGNKTPSEVKQRVIEIMYKWTRNLKQEPKIGEAYQMLKQQGVVTDDPIYLDQIPKSSSSPSPRPKNSIFDDDEKSRLLHRLLQSKNPEDLQAANRLIKNMVKEDEKRMERVSKRMRELETVNNNVKLLEEMLANYRTGISSKEEIELMKELYQSCDRLRPNLFCLASDVGENDEGIAEILKTNDELGQVMIRYRSIFGDEKSESKTAGDSVPSLLDLNSPVGGNTPETNSASEISLLDDQLLGLGLDDKVTSLHNNVSNATSKSSELQEIGDLFNNTLLAGQQNAKCEALPALNNTMELFDSLSPTPSLLPQPFQPNNLNKTKLINDEKMVNDQNNQENHKTGVKGLEDLDVLGQTLLKQALPLTLHPGAEFPKPPDKIPMNQLPKKTNSNPGSPALQRTAFASDSLSASSSPSRSPAHEVQSLANLFVPLETIQPGTTPPLTLYDKNGLNVVLHFGKNVPRPDVSVMVVTTMSKNPDPIKNVLFQSAVPKTMKVKLQPPSATSLPGHNPILPPAAITQIMLLANPMKDKVRLKYKVSYTVNDQPYTDIGEIDSLPVS